MKWEFGRTKLAVVIAGLCVIGILMTLTLRAREASAAQQVPNFMGGAPEILDRGAMGDVAALRLRFPAGVRSNWHTHTDGQLLMVESGVGLHQVRGQPIEVKGPGEPWWTPPGVEHWHGAAPDQDVVQWTFYSGSVDWMDPVTDDQYRMPASR
jgi:quercetin dioxygenase-like cupin family protein